eukprot:1444005-Amphidinium_carterae.1
MMQQGFCAEEILPNTCMPWHRPSWDVRLCHRQYNMPHGRRTPQRTVDSSRVGWLALEVYAMLQPCDIVATQLGGLDEEDGHDGGHGEPSLL